MMNYTTHKVGSKSHQQLTNYLVKKLKRKEPRKEVVRLKREYFFLKKVLTY